MASAPPTNEARILEYVQVHRGVKAADIARGLGIERRIVNRLLQVPLRGRLRQDRQYRWFPAGGAEPETSEIPPLERTDLSRLCHYYLDCLEGDQHSGASVFAASRPGSFDYAEVNKLPFSEAGGNPLLEEGAAALVRRAARERGLNVFLGYPVRLRKHRARSGWEGLFVEPLLLFGVEAGADGPGEEPRVADALPVFNHKALEALADGNVLEEAAALAEELGLDQPLEVAPEIDELLTRLHAVRPEWDWRGNPDPDTLESGPPLSEIGEAGIRNRAVVLLAERTPYTQGLETELKQLADVPEGHYTGTALGAWMRGETEEDGADAGETAVPLEVVPMNTEQREAVRKALACPLSVITGPPGTGKSQVVTSLLVNAAWSGRRVLFASKNNKAVDVVEARVNGLGPRPVLIRIGGRRELQERLAEFIAALLAATCTEGDRTEFEACRESHAALAAELDALGGKADKVVTLRNRVDHLEREIADLREDWGQDAFDAARDLDPDSATRVAARLGAAVKGYDRSRQGLLVRAAWFLLRAARFKELQRTVAEARPFAAALGVAVLAGAATEEKLSTWRAAAARLEARAGRVKAVREYSEALAALRSATSIEVLSQREAELAERLSEESAAMWRLWVRLQPDRFSAEQRRLLGDYSAVLRMIVRANQGGQRLGKEAWRKYYQLFPKVSPILPCWAVTSLAARNRVPFEPGYFDLLVIDEASQCDIASALPLLYRAKRAVIIGDPKQLRHISTLPPERDQRLQEKHGVFDRYLSWGYSVNSLQTS